METLVAVAHHRNQYYSHGGKGNSPIRFGSLPSKGFRDINCRAFESGVGLLPSPFKGYGSTTVSKKGPLSPKVQSPNANVGGKSRIEDVKTPKKPVKSSPIPIKGGSNGSTKKERLARESFSLSELWAGPAYSNSPPPSSLPIPKFSVKPKRTVSLELPLFESDLNLEPMAKSAPASPARESASVDFLRDDDFATKTLRRILNLDIADD